MGFCARLAGRCPAPAPPMLFCFCSGLDKHRRAFGCYLLLFYLYSAAVPGLDVKTSSPAQSPTVVCKFYFAMNTLRLAAVFSYLKVFLLQLPTDFFVPKSKIKSAYNRGFAARLAGRWSNGHFIAVVLQPGWTFIVGLLFVNFYFYIFIQQRFRADKQ